MKSLASWLPQSIAGRLTLWFMSIALLPSLLLLVAIIWIARGELEGAFNEKLILLDRIRVQELETYANERLREIDLVSRTPVMAKALDEFSALAQDERDKAEINAKYRSIFENLIEPLGYPNMLLLSPQGEVLFRLRPGFEVGQVMKQAPFKGTALADSIDKCLAQVPPTISAPEIYPSTGSEENLIFTSQTVVKDDKTIGIVLFQLDP